MVDLRVVADQIEFDGTAAMSTGGANNRPMSEEMTILLPVAWIRLLSYASEADPDFALCPAQHLAENLEKFKSTEFIETTRTTSGPAEFIDSLSMPLMGLRSILTGRPLLDFM